MIIKRLTRQGNSAALIIDRTLMDLLDIDQDTDLKLTVDGRKLVIEPMVVDAPEEERAVAFADVVKRTGEANAELFRRLAK